MNIGINQNWDCVIQRGSVGNPGWYGDRYLDPLTEVGDWILCGDNNGTGSIANGVMTITNGADFATKEGILTVGESYTFTCDMVKVAGAEIRIATTPETQDGLAYANAITGVFSLTFTADDPDFQIQARSSVFTGTLQNIIITKN